jgi:esterase/lipase superfamily enzyme
MQFQNHIVLLLLSLMLVGCSASHKLMPTPNIYTNGGSYPDEDVPQGLKSSKVDLLFVTDRVPEIIADGLFEYGTGRSASVGFGSAIVEIGSNLSWQELVRISETSTRDFSPSIRVISRNEIGRFPETPYTIIEDKGMIRDNPETHVKYERVATQFRQEINRRMSKINSNEIQIFIHGFNNSFDEGAVSLAELWHFLGRHGVPLLYSWPAAQGGLFGYFIDRESGEFTVFHLKKLFKLLASFPEVERINLIAHSRGAAIAATALRELVIEARAGGHDPLELYRIRNWILPAPDLDFDIVRQRLMAEKLGLAFGQITIYTTNTDKALGLSQTLLSGTRSGRIRVSDLGKQEQAIFKSIKNVAFIDVQSTKSFIGHSYYLNNPSTSSDIIRIINSGAKPGSPERPLNHRMLNFWEMPADYPVPMD